MAFPDLPSIKVGRPMIAGLFFRGESSFVITTWMVIPGDIQSQMAPPVSRGYFQISSQYSSSPPRPFPVAARYSSWNEGLWSSGPVTFPSARFLISKGLQYRGPTISSNGIWKLLPPYMNPGRLGSIFLPSSIRS